jgi:riboflavin synthase
MVQGHVDQHALSRKKLAVGSILWIWPRLNNHHWERLDYGKRSESHSSRFEKNQFSVAIIPYTHEHTNFNSFEIGTEINLEFDVMVICF